MAGRRPPSLSNLGDIFSLITSKIILFYFNPQGKIIENKWLIPHSVSAATHSVANLLIIHFHLTGKRKRSNPP
jgi:hypothetical protein